MIYKNVYRKTVDMLYKTKILLYFIVKYDDIIGIARQNGQCKIIMEETICEIGILWQLPCQ